MVQIDATELARRECYAARSRSELAALVGSRRVRLDVDRRLDEVDRYGLDADGDGAGCEDG